MTNAFILRRDLWIHCNSKSLGYYINTSPSLHLSLSPNHFLWEIISLISTNEYRSIHPSRYLCKGMRRNCELFLSIFHSFRHDQSRILKCILPGIGKIKWLMHFWLESVIEFLFVTENIHKFDASCDQDYPSNSWYLQTYRSIFGG